VVIRHTEPVKTYSGNTSYKIYREYFDRACLCNEWRTKKAQRLLLAMEGAAAEAVRGLMQPLTRPTNKFGMRWPVVSATNANRKGRCADLMRENSLNMKLLSCSNKPYALSTAKRGRTPIRNLKIRIYNDISLM